MVFYSIRNLIIGYSVAVLVVLMILAMTFYNLRSQEVELDKITKASQIMRGLEPCLVEMQEFESELNYIFLFGKDKYGHTYEERLQRLKEDSSVLSRLSALDPGKKTEYDQLKNHIQRMAAYSRRIMELPGSNGLSISNYQRDSGAVILKGFKTIIEKLENESRATLANSYDKTINLTRRSLTFVSIISAVLVLTLAICFRLSYREIRNRINQNLLQRQQAEAALERSQQNYSALINAVDGIVWEANAKTFEFTFVSKQAERLLGYPSQRWIDEPTFWYDHIFEEDRDWATAYCKKCTLEKRSHEFEYRMIAADGGIVWLRDIVSVILEDGEPSQLRGIMVDITGPKQIEQRLKESIKEIRQLTDYLQNIREEERTKIAREIHDELGQQLSVLKMDFSWLSKKFDESDVVVTQRMNSLRDVLDSTVKTVRKIAGELRPSLLDDLGLVAAMEWHLKEFERYSGIKTKFSDTESEEPPVSKATKTGLYRIFQESLTNVARHASAKKVCINLDQNKDAIILKIEDDGIGFDAKKAVSEKTLGILGMKERTLMMGGIYTINSRPGKGTIVEVSVPVTQD